MPDDPRIKVVLKRYRKEEQYFDASMELIDVSVDLLRDACRYEKEDFSARPRELDGKAQAFLSTHIGMDFDEMLFDYFLHPYVRNEFVSTYYKDPSVKVRPTPESGPPTNMPLPAGMHWVAVRPKDGKEQFIGVRDEG